MLSFPDPDGLRIELVFLSDPRGEPWPAGPVPPEHAIRGFHGATISEEGYENSAKLLTEVMGSSLRTRETLLYGESENRTFQEIIEAGGTMGWHSFDQSLLKAYKADLITDETALIFCAHKNKMRRDLEMLKKLRNMSFDEPSGLQMDVDSAPKVWSAA